MRCASVQSKHSCCDWEPIQFWQFQLYLWRRTVNDFEDWTNWLFYKGGIGDKGKNSWEVWWVEEHEHIQTTRGRFWEIVLSLRFFIIQYGIVYALNVSGHDKNFRVSNLSSLQHLAYYLTCALLKSRWHYFISFYSWKAPGRVVFVPSPTTLLCWLDCVVPEISKRLHILQLLVTCFLGGVLLWMNTGLWVFLVGIGRCGSFIQGGWQISSTIYKVFLAFLYLSARPKFYQSLIYF